MSALFDARTASSWRRRSRQSFALLCRDHSSVTRRIRLSRLPPTLTSFVADVPLIGKQDSGAMKRSAPPVTTALNAG